tara:strand:- start:750 stop:1427 length:678 start_codon:yes stop_codon:yes gene_type:complete
MAWRFPDENFKNAGVMNTEDTNAAMRPSVEELSGELNEQNFARNAFTTATNYDKDVAYRHAKLEVDVKGDDATGPEAMFTDNNAAILAANTAWQSIEDTGTNTPFRYNFVSRGGLLFITARLWGAQLGVSGAGSLKLNPILFALKINGALIPESADGNLDVLDYTKDKFTGNTARFSINIDFVIPVVPGDTTVELVARVRPQPAESQKFTPMVGSRSLILWEITK